MEICELVAEGRTLKSICAQPDMPHPATVRRWVVNFPEAAAAMVAAREISAFELEEEALGLAQRLASTEKFDRDKIRSFEVAMNQYRWSAGKRNPRVFSDKLPPSFSIGVQITTPLDIGGDSGKEIEGVYTIEAMVPQGEEDARHPRDQDVLDNAEGKPMLKERANVSGRDSAKNRERTAARRAKKEQAADG